MSSAIKRVPVHIVLALALTLASSAQATEFPVQGGWGGSYARMMCPAGTYLDGFTGYSGAWIDMLYPKCKRVETNEEVMIELDAVAKRRFGDSTGGLSTSPTCNRGEAMFALEFTMTEKHSRPEFVEQIRFYCASMTTNDRRDRRPHQIGKGSRPRQIGSDLFVHFMACPANEWAIGIHGHHGLYVDGLGLICGAWQAAAPPPKPLPGLRPAPMLPITITGGMQDHVDRPGNDYRREALRTVTPQSCQKLCYRDPKCEAWTFVREHFQGPTRVCYLKAPAPAAVTGQACCISGIKPSALDPTPKPPAPPPPSPTPAPPADEIGPDMEDNTDRPGGDYRTVPLLQRLPEICQSSCRGDERCKAWTYVRPGVQGPFALCYLKDQTPAPRPSGCCVSGLKIPYP